MKTQQEAVTVAQAAITRYTAAAERYRGKVAEEMLAAAGKAGAKHSAIRRIMETENELTKKPHTATSAEAIVETDDDYSFYLQHQRLVVAEKLTAEAQMVAAKLEAELAIAVAGVAPVEMLAHD